MQGISFMISGTLCKPAGTGEDFLQSLMHQVPEI
jgi:hypothetical protein